MKEIKESSKAKTYYFDLMIKMSNGKKLNQRERVFVELYLNPTVPCYHFTLQCKPAILQYNARIKQLRDEGFVIPPPKLSFKNGQKHSVYELDKNSFMCEVKKTWWQSLWSA